MVSALDKSQKHWLRKLCLNWVSRLLRADQSLFGHTQSLQTAYFVSISDSGWNIGPSLHLRIKKANLSVHQTMNFVSSIYKYNNLNIYDVPL